MSKRRMLSILLSLALCLTLLPPAAMAAEPEGTALNLNDNSQFSTFEVASTTYLRFQSGGIYYLSGDTTLTTGPLYIGRKDGDDSNNYEVTLDLKGHTLKAPNSNSAIVVGPGGTLILKDSSTAQTGKVQGGGSTTTIMVKNKLSFSSSSITGPAAFTLDSGTVFGCSGSDPAVQLDSNVAGGNRITFTMNDGTLWGANADGTYKIDNPALKISKASGAADITFNANGGEVNGAFENGSHNKSGAAVQKQNNASGTTFNGQVNNWNGTLVDGMYNGEVNNHANSTITGGTFYGKVTNTPGSNGSSGGTITNGTFYGTVINHSGHNTVGPGQITGGTFYGTVKNYGGSSEVPDDKTALITGGTFYGPVVNNETQSPGTSATNRGQLKGGMFYDLPEKPDGQDGKDYYRVNFKWNRSASDNDNYYSVYVMNKDIRIQPLPAPTWSGLVLPSDYDEQWNTERGGNGTDLDLQNIGTLFPSGNEDGYPRAPGEGYNLYAQWEILTTVEVPYTVTVRQGGTAAGAGSLEVVYKNGTEIKNTYGDGIDSRDLIFNNVRESQSSMAAFRETETLHSETGGFSQNLWELLNGDGVFIRLKLAGQTMGDWSYGDEVWRITVDPDAVSSALSGGGSNIPGGTINSTNPPNTQNGGTTPNSLIPGGGSGGGGSNADSAPSGGGSGGSNPPDDPTEEPSEDDPAIAYSLHGAADAVSLFTLTSGGESEIALFAEGAEYSVVPLTPENGLVIHRVIGTDGSGNYVVDEEHPYTRAEFTLTYNGNASTSGGGGGGSPTPSKPATDPKNLNDRPNGLNWWDHYAYIQGYADGTFRPSQSVTRAQAAVMLYRLLTPERLAQIETTRHSFTDIPSGAWYETAAATMANGGYISGFADGTFRGDQPITRAQFVTILARFLTPRNASCDFNDVSRSFWAYQPIADTTDAGWISGYADGTFRPSQTITRAQVTAILNRALNRGVDDSSTLLSFHNFPDNPAAAWHYYEVIEAANGHDYTGQRPSEHWTSLR